MFRCRALGLALALLAPTALPAAEHLVLATQEYPPYNMSDAQGKIVGISTEIVSALMAEAGYEFEIGMYPWARAIEMARTKPYTCVFSMSRTPEREATYQWIGPLVYNDWALFALADTTRPAQLEDARQMRVGSYKGDAIVTYLQVRGFDVDAATSDELNPRKLVHRRIDYWATGRLIGEYRLHEQGITNIVQVLTFNRTDMYLACQKDLPAPLVLKLSQTLDSLVKRGVVARIYVEHGYTP